MVTLPEMHAVLQRLVYPATRDELLTAARKLEVSEAVIARLETLPEHRYGSVNTVMDTLRGQA